MSESRINNLDSGAKPEFPGQKLYLVRNYPTVNGSKSIHSLGVVSADSELSAQQLVVFVLRARGLDINPLDVSTIQVEEIDTNKPSTRLFFG